MKKIAIIVLAFAMAFGAVSCKEKGEADISVWTTYDTVKFRGIKLITKQCRRNSDFPQ